MPSYTSVQVVNPQTKVIRLWKKDRTFPLRVLCVVLSLVMCAAALGKDALLTWDLTVYKTEYNYGWGWKDARWYDPLGGEYHEAYCDAADDVDDSGPLKVDGPKNLCTAGQGWISMGALGLVFQALALCFVLFMHGWCCESFAVFVALICMSGAVGIWLDLGLDQAVNCNESHGNLFNLIKWSCEPGISVPLMGAAIGLNVVELILRIFAYSYGYVVVFEKSEGVTLGYTRMGN